MTGTLLKHEWLRTRGALGVYFGAVLLVGVAGSLLGATGWAVLSAVGLALGFLAVAVTLPGAQLLLAADYWRTGYGRTGYFTHSIPVRGSRIFWAKLLWAALVAAVAVVLTAVLAWIAWWSLSVTSDITAPSPALIGEALGSITDYAPAWMIIVGAVVLLVSMVSTTIYYYFAISVGHESRLASLGAGGPIVVFVGLYICTQVLSLLGMVLIPMGVGVEAGRLVLVSFNVFDEMSVGATGGSEAMPVGFLVALLLFVVFCLWRTVRSWDRRVALR